MNDALVGHFVQDDRERLLRTGRAYRKKSRVIAKRIDHDFDVETDRGVMSAVAGDYLVTNHPDDDPGSDLWTISAARMAATYEATPSEDLSASESVRTNVAR